MKTALVLGGTGTIGHQLCKRLKKEGYWVKCVDRKYNDYSPSAADEIAMGDLRDIDFARKSMHIPGQRFDLVFALMAEMGGANYIFSKENDSEIIYNSALMNLNVSKVASEMKVGKILFSSSACMYGEKLQMETDSVSLKENMAWEGGKPDSVYGVEKLFSEDVYDSFRRNNKLNIRMCRFHNVFATESVYKGGREKFPAAICRKVAEATDGGEIEVFGDGNQVRSFLWIEEALDGIMRLMDSDYTSAVNIGSDESISINDLTKMVIGFSGKNLSIKNVPSDATGVRGRNSNNELIKNILGWSPSQPLRVGMEKLYSWISKQINQEQL